MDRIYLIMSKYYNFEQNSQCISYEPYMYDKGNNYRHLILGVIAIFVGIGLNAFNVWKEGIFYGIISGFIIIVNGLYGLLIQAKTKIEFNKLENTLYKHTLLGKTKKIALSNIYNIITVSENGTYAYHITNKTKPHAKSIVITSFINKSRLLMSEIQFLESYIIPDLMIFLQLDNHIVMQPGKIKY